LCLCCCSGRIIIIDAVVAVVCIESICEWFFLFSLEKERDIEKKTWVLIICEEFVFSVVFFFWVVVVVVVVLVVVVVSLVQNSDLYRCHLECGFYWVFFGPVWVCLTIIMLLFVVGHSCSSVAGAPLQFAIASASQVRRNSSCLGIQTSA
jgi:hypothetical protein